MGFFAGKTVTMSTILCTNVTHAKYATKLPVFSANLDKTQDSSVGRGFQCN